MEEYNEHIDDNLFTYALILIGAVTSASFVINILLEPTLNYYWPFVLIAFALGSSMASFFGAMVERLPKGESTSTPSHCACGRNLKPWENVPVLGWLTLKITNYGKTKCCNSTLPKWYVLMEAITGFAFAGMSVFFISTQNFNPWIIATSLIAILTIIFIASDYRSSIPDTEETAS